MVNTSPSGNMKAFSITHVISVLSGAATAIVWSIEFFTHAAAFSAGTIFMGATVPIAYAGVMSYYAMSLKASASGISESTSAPSAPKA